MRIENALRWVLGLAMIGIGVAHFVNPAPFVAIMPPYLPAHYELVLISGFFEIAGGIGLQVPQTRRAAAIGLVLLYVAVFPANVHMAMAGITPPGAPEIPRWAAWARLPFQLVLIAWAGWYARPRAAMERDASDTAAR